MSERERKQCGDCGYSNAPRAGVCRRCGAALVGAADGQPTQAWAPPTEPLWRTIGAASSPTEAFESPTERLDPRTERLDPARERLDPARERLDPPPERLDPPPERLDPPPERLDPPPLVWADAPARSALFQRVGSNGFTRPGPPGSGPARFLAAGALAVLAVVAIVIIASNSGGGESRSAPDASAGHRAGHKHASDAALAQANGTDTTAGAHTATSAGAGASTTSTPPATTTGAGSASTTAGGGSATAAAPTTTAGGGSATAAAPTTTDGGSPAATPTSTTGSTPRSGGGSPASAASATTNYTGAGFSAAVPAGWTTTENDMPKSTFTESKWQNFADGSTLLVDYQSASGASPQGQAAPVRRAVAKQAGYSELGWGPGNLAGKKSWKWTFSLPSQGESVDYFFSACGKDYAVLGTAPPDRFGALAGRFKAFAASVKHC